MPWSFISSRQRSSLPIVSPRRRLSCFSSRILCSYHSSRFDDDDSCTANTTTRNYYYYEYYNYNYYSVVKVVMCSGGGAQPLRHRRRKGSLVGRHHGECGARAYNGGLGAEPLVSGSGGEAPLKLKAFWSLDVQRSRQI